MRFHLGIRQQDHHRQQRQQRHKLAVHRLTSYTVSVIRKALDIQLPATAQATTQRSGRQGVSSNRCVVGPISLQLAPKLLWRVRDPGRRHYLMSLPLAQRHRPALHPATRSSFRRLIRNMSFVASAQRSYIPAESTYAAGTVLRRLSSEDDGLHVSSSIMADLPCINGRKSTK